MYCIHCRWSPAKSNGNLLTNPDRDPTLGERNLLVIPMPTSSERVWREIEQSLDLETPIALETAKEPQLAAIIQHTIKNIQRLPPTQPEELNAGIFDLVHLMGLNNAVRNPPHLMNGHTADEWNRPKDAFSALWGEINLPNHSSEYQVEEELNEITLTAANERKLAWRSQSVLGNDVGASLF